METDATLAFPFVAQQRYYLPNISVAVLVAYAVAVKGKATFSRIGTVFRLAGQGYVFSYLAVAAVSVALLPVPTRLGSNKRAKLMAAQYTYRWPSMKIEYELSVCRQYVLDFFKNNPEAVIVTNRPQWFYVEPEVDRSRIHRLGEIRSSYVTGPAQILVITEDAFDTTIQDLYWTDTTPHRSDELAGLHPFRLIAHFPEEQVKILETRVGPRERVVL